MWTGHAEGKQDGAGLFFSSGSLLIPFPFVTGGFF